MRMPHRDEFLGKGIFCLIVRKYREAGCIAGARKSNPNIRKKLSKIFAKLRKNSFPGCIADRKDKSLSEMEVLQMQNAMRVDAMPQEDEIPDEELIDTLIAISVVAKRLAMKLRKIKDEGDKQNEPHE